MLQNEGRTFFFFFFFASFTFQIHLNLFWVYQNGNFLLGKSISRRKNNLKSEKMTMPPKKYSSYAPGREAVLKDQVLHWPLPL